MAAWSPNTIYTYLLASRATTCLFMRYRDVDGAWTVIGLVFAYELMHVYTQLPKRLWIDPET